MTKYNWFKHSVTGRAVVAVAVFNLMASQCVPLGYVLSATADAGEGEGAQGAVTIGALFTEDEVNGLADVIVPVWGDGRSLIFFNPRFSATDTDQQEFNLGVGFRSIVSPGSVIVGGNAYYDIRRADSEKDYDQIGVGLEFFGKWVDARFNCYLADSTQKLINSYVQESSATSTSTSWGAIHAEGHTLWQDQYVRSTTTTTRRTFNQYEAGMDGFDAEVGVRIPYLDKYAETRVFLGCQKFDNPFGDDFDGLKGRLEVRAMPGVTLDAEYYGEDELNESDYSVGVRVQLPFSVANVAEGRNPFAGASEQFRLGQSRPFSDRLTEMVIRDVKVQTEQSEFTEDTTKQSGSTSSTTHKKNVVITGSGNFVDGDNKSGVEDGSYEHPWDTITEGVDNVYGDKMVIVFDSADPYRENVTLTGGVKLHGVYTGNGGKTFGARPTAIGDGQAPVFTMAENTTIAGFLIQNPGEGQQQGKNGASRYGILSNGNSGLVIDDVIINDVAYGIVLNDTLTDANDAFVARISRTQVTGAEVSGVRIGVIGAPVKMGAKSLGGSGGACDIAVSDSVFSDNGQSGLDIGVYGCDMMRVAVDNLTAHGNLIYGAMIYVEGAGEEKIPAGGTGVCEIGIRNSGFSGNGWGLVVLEREFDSARVASDNVTANGNEWGGIYASVEYNGSLAQLTMTDVTANGNGTGETKGMPCSGIWMGGVSAEGTAQTVLDGITAQNNDGYGVYVDEGAWSWGNGGSASFTLRNALVTGNSDDGVMINTGAGASSGNASATLENIVARGNGLVFGGGDGISVYTLAAAQAGDVTGTIRNVVADNNARCGVEIWGDTGAFTGYGDATFTMENVTASNNGFVYGWGAGVAVDYGAWTYEGNAVTTISGVTAENNAGEGVWMYTGAYAGYGDATLTMQNVAVNNNLGRETGIHVNTGARAGYGDAVVSLSNLTAENNGGHGITFGTGAHSAYGDATFTMQNVTANNNGFIWGDGDGIEIRTVAFAGYGDATATFDTLVAEHNAGYGIQIVGAGTGAHSRSGGDATFTMQNVTASYNGWGDEGGDGVFVDIGAWSGDGNASATLANVTANNNDGDGVLLWTGARAGYGGGDALFSMQNITAGGNSGSGIRFATGSYAGYGDAFTTLDGVAADYNGRSGIEIGANATGAHAGYGDATFVMRNVEANYNGWDSGSGAGITVDMGAFAEEGNAVASLVNVTADNNAGTGLALWMGAYAGYGGGDATFTMQNVSATFNGETGIYVDGGGAYALGGDAVATLTDVNASYNGEHGMVFYEFGARADSCGDATFTMTSVTANDNGGNGITFGNTVARTENGNADATFDTIAANDNGGYGILIWARGAHTTSGGNAALSMTSVTANDNGDCGIYFDDYAAIAGGGSASATFNGVTANRSGVDGIQFDDWIAWAGNGNATATFNTVTANQNSGHGIVVEQSGAWSAAGGDAMFSMQNVTANENGVINSGIHVETGARSADGEASVLLDTVTANDNVGSGIYFTAGAIGSGDASISLSSVTANDNDLVGIYFGATGALSTAGNASVTMQSVEAGGNDSIGIMFRSQSSIGYASAVFDTVTANDNGLDGIWGWIIGPDAQGEFDNVQANENGRLLAGQRGLNVSVQATGFGMWDLDNVEANGNSGTGMRLDMRDADTAEIYLNNVTANENGEDGVRLPTGIAVGAMTAGGSYNQFRDNAASGLAFEIYGTTRNLDFGGGGYVSGAGNNSFEGNGLLGVRNIAGGTVYVEGNYWGGGAPVLGTDYSAGVQAPTSYLTTDPNPPAP